MKKIKLRSKIADRGAAKHNFITQLVLQKDWNYPQKDGVPILPAGVMQMALNNDRDFFIKLGRALTRGKTYKNAPVHNFIMLHWDELKGLTAEKACDVLMKQFPDGTVYTADNYRKILKQLPVKLDK